MEILSAVSTFLSQAKANLIRAGIEMNKIPVPMQHGCKLLRMVADLDKIEQWTRSSEGSQAESEAVRGKPKRSKRLKAKERQSQPAERQPESSNKNDQASAAGPTVPFESAATQKELPRGSKLIG